MNKRGQVTVFIILGIIVLAIIGLLFYFRANIFGTELGEEEAERFVSARVEPVKSVVRNCVAARLIEGVHLVSWQGGFYDPANYETSYIECDTDCLIGGGEETSCCTDQINVGYACESNHNTLPLVSFIAGEINQFISNEEERQELEDCIKGAFDDFEAEALKLDYEFIDLFLNDPVIMLGEIRQEIDFPVRISRSGYSTNFRNIEVTIDSNLLALWYIAADVTNEECGGGGFEIDDYVWEREQGGDILAGSIENGAPGDYQPWYLQSYEFEGDGKPLRFFFMIDQ